jgi:DNA polymerase II small subunit/DNA polymerase delta subunit B
MEDVITYSYDSVIEKIYDYKEKNKELPNSIDEYLKEARPLGNNNAKIENVEYRKKDATFELSIKCEYYGKKYEYLYQDPENLSDNQRARIRTKAHGWAILRQK